MANRIRRVDVGIALNVREWDGDGTPFVLLHGLSSNSLTWEQVGDRLAQAGHRVVAVDQRGHGLSDKPDSGYDFATVAADLARLLDVLGLDQPVVVGQSWGGNLVLEFGARYPGRARGLAFVDGGIIHLQSRPDGDWQTISAQLRPPLLAGTPRETLAGYIRSGHPDWTEAGIEATLGNFETLPDGTVRPWLTLDRHMTILRAMWEQEPPRLYPLVQEPVLIALAREAHGSEREEAFARMVKSAEEGLKQVQVVWFQNTDHDIHVHRPDELARLFLDTLANGLWRHMNGRRMT